MLLKLLEKKAEGSSVYPLDEVVFYDTGMEFGAIYHVRDQIKELLDYYEVPLTVLTPERPFMYDMLERPVHSKQKGDHNGYGWCGGLCRWGTRNKLDALDRYAKERNAIVYIGIAVDEPQRLTRLEEYKRAPLAEWGMTEQEALEFCWSKGIHWTEDPSDLSVPDLYKILDRVSCWCCCNKNQKELKNIYTYLPGYWDKLIELQNKLERPMKRFRTDPVFGNLGDIRNLGAYWDDQKRQENKSA
ncbi:hypothetical protein bpr_II099 (plasmid) [Butyrivibrio proteoclasticus B316]|uniref:Phosphoadenosine phosphosulfate reductase family protein n=2 Tax=Butyrivibrio proteoclasticus TaxID=43305 RepID=E0S3Q6_BUTPB|nr:hypothetical protein bpr_II099 [Butyrivibrio proteoclasticus B316]